MAAPGGYGPLNTCPDDNDIYSTVPDYYYTIQDICPNLQLNYSYLWGTSMAAPIVTGIVALMLSIKPDLSSSEVRNILQSTADDKGLPGFDVYYGHGRVNAYKSTVETVRRLADENKTLDDKSTGINNSRRLTKDQNGNYHFVFTSGNNIFYRKSTDNGNSWSSTVHLSIDGGQNIYPSITTHGDYVFVTYQQYNGIENNQHKYTIKGWWKQLIETNWHSMTISVPLYFTTQVDPMPVIVAANNVDNNYNSAQSAPEVMIGYLKSDGVYHSNLFYLLPSGDDPEYSYFQQGGDHKITGTTSDFRNPSIAKNSLGQIMLTAHSLAGSIYAYYTTGGSWTAIPSSSFNMVK